jgi:hypothetical protein
MNQLEQWFFERTGVYPLKELSSKLSYYFTKGSPITLIKLYDEVIIYQTNIAIGLLKLK